MEISTENINWIVSAGVGVITSVIGAFIYQMSQKFITANSEKRNVRQVEYLIKRKEVLKKRYENITDFLVHYLGVLFYILMITLVATSIGYLADFIGVGELLLNLLRFGLYLGAASMAWASFYEMMQYKNFAKTINEIDKSIEQLNNKSR